MAPSVSSLKNLDLSLLAQRLGRLCLQLGVEVTAAESCTGGGIASANRTHTAKRADGLDGL